MPIKVGSVEVLLTTPNSPSGRYDGLRPGTTLLKSGHKAAPERAPILVDTIFESDVAVTMRDGTILRADIYRPATADDGGTKVPVILCWSPYGKRGGAFQSLDVMPYRVGVPKSRNSEYQTFEAPDPAEWTAKGYAICNIDARGVFDSEGDIRWWGQAEALDGYDTIEWLATLPWCNSNVGLCGNSWLAISQWFIAAENPPHLKCIAPLEGACDLYREFVAPGGIPSTGFMGLMNSAMFGRNKSEDVLGMALKDPHWNDYWEDKKAKLEKIDIPAYIVASYSTQLHSPGAFHGYERVKGPKWLRVHSSHEWHDLYSQSCGDELKKFYDRYLKGVQNDWESTPQLRISLLQYNKPAIPNRVFTNWPVPEAKYKRFYLTSTGKLEESQPDAASSGVVSYKGDSPSRQDGTDTEELEFEFKFDKDTFLIGYPRATIYASCPDHDDMDVYVQVTKKDANGKPLVNLNILPEELGIPEEEIPNINILKHVGPAGRLRASLREVDENQSTEHYLVHSFRKTEKITPGEVVKLQIPIWPAGIAFAAGESVVFKVSGHEMRFAEMQYLYNTATTVNKGTHNIYCGASGYFSEVVLPLMDQ